MRRTYVSLWLCLVVSVCAFASQGNTSTKKSEKPAVDCATANDNSITTSVKEKLASTPSLKGASINVETTNGEVTLTGKVRTSSLKGVATRVAKKVACVKKVNNKLTFEVNTAPKRKTGS